jgi:hypothetical protein
MSENAPENGKECVHRLHAQRARSAQRCSGARQVAQQRQQETGHRRAQTCAAVRASVCHVRGLQAGGAAATLRAQELVDAHQPRLGAQRSDVAPGERKALQSRHNAGQQRRRAPRSRLAPPRTRPAPLPPPPRARAAARRAAQSLRASPQKATPCRRRRQRRPTSAPPGPAPCRAPAPPSARVRCRGARNTQLSQRTSARTHASHCKLRVCVHRRAGVERQQRGGRQVDDAVADSLKIVDDSALSASALCISADAFWQMASASAVHAARATSHSGSDSAAAVAAGREQPRQRQREDCTARA